MDSSTNLDRATRPVTKERRRKRSGLSRRADGESSRDPRQNETSTISEFTQSRTFSSHGFLRGFRRVPPFVLHSSRYLLGHFREAKTAGNRIGKTVTSVTLPYFSYELLGDRGPVSCVPCGFVNKSRPRARPVTKERRRKRSGLSRRADGESSRDPRQNETSTISEFTQSRTFSSHGFLRCFRRVSPFVLHSSRYLLGHFREAKTAGNRIGKTVTSVTLPYFSYELLGDRGPVSCVPCGFVNKSRPRARPVTKERRGKRSGLSRRADGALGRPRLAEVEGLRQPSHPCSSFTRPVRRWPFWVAANVPRRLSRHDVPHVLRERSSWPIDARRGLGPDRLFSRRNGDAHPRVSSV